MPGGTAVDAFWLASIWVRSGQSNADASLNARAAGGPRRLLEHGDIVGRRNRRRLQLTGAWSRVRSYKIVRRMGSRFATGGRTGRMGKPPHLHAEAMAYTDMNSGDGGDVAGRVATLRAQRYIEFFHAQERVERLQPARRGSVAIAPSSSTRRMSLPAVLFEQA
jgi:hypothetical protein